MASNHEERCPCGSDVAQCTNVHCAYNRGARDALRGLQATLAALRKIKPEMLQQVVQEALDTETVERERQDAPLTVQDIDFAWPDKLDPKFRPLLEISHNTRLRSTHPETKRLADIVDSVAPNVAYERSVVVDVVTCLYNHLSVIGDRTEVLEIDYAMVMMVFDMASHINARPENVARSVYDMVTAVTGD